MKKPRFLLPIHRWIALILAPLLMVQALTGCALLFREELARVIGPAATTEGPSASVSAIVSAAGSAYPGSHVARLFFPAHDGDIAFAKLTADGRADRYVAIDPGDARVLAAGPIWRFPLEAALQIHFRLMTGWVGNLVVVLNGLALIALCITGLIHWWPGRGRISQSLRVRRNLPARLKLRAWHRSIGPVSAPLLLFSAVTGVLLAVSELPSLQSTVAPDSLSAPIELSAEQIDAAMDLAGVVHPGAGMRDVRFLPDGILTINFFVPRGGPRDVDVVNVSGPESRIVSMLPVEENPALWIKVLPLHSGDILGLAGRLILLAGGAGLIFLTISGPLAWWRTRHSRAAKPKERST